MGRNRDFQATRVAAILPGFCYPRSYMTDKKRDAREKPQQTVITKEDYEAQQFAAHLLGEDGDMEQLPPSKAPTSAK
jgi:hypothetical protein